MERINCLIVEDEPLACEVLLDYIKETPMLICKHVCSDALQAMEILNANQIDLIFLDIHLPKIKGLDFLRALTNPPRVIITTAHREFAIEGFDLNVVDYLLKPVSFVRFLTAVNKLNSLPFKKTDLGTREIGTGQGHIFININKKRVKLLLEDIEYIESRREYINIITGNGSFLTKHQLSEVEGLLSNNKFLRIHRCYIVSINKVSAYDATEVNLSGIKLPIGRSYKELVFSVLGTA